MSQLKTTTRITSALAVGILLCGGILGVAPALALDGSEILARVGGTETVTVQELIEHADFRGALRPKEITDTAVTGPLLDELIERRLISLDAASVTLQHDKRLATSIQLETTKLALGMYEVEVLIPSLRFDSAQIDSHYQANIGRYSVPHTQRYVRQITVFKKGQGVPEAYTTYVDPVYQDWDDPLRKIDSIYTRLANGEDFTTLALAHSEEIRAKATGGELGWVSFGGLREVELRDMFFSLPPHMISKPFESPFGYHIAQVTGIREPGPAPIDPIIEADILDLLQRAAGRIRAEDITDSLARVGRVEYNQDALATPDSLLEEEAVMAIVNSRDTVWGATYHMQKTASSTFRRQPLLTAEEKQHLLEPMVRNALLRNGVRIWGFYDRPEIQEVRRTMEERRQHEIVRDRFTQVDHIPDSSAVEEYYRKHIREFTPERRHNVFMTKSGTRDDAGRIAVQWREGEPPTGAESRWVGPDDLPSAVWNKIASIPPGDVVGPIGVKDEYWTVKLNQIAEARPLREVRSLISSRILEARREKQHTDWLMAAKRRHPVQRFNRLLAKVVLPTRQEYQSQKTAVAGMHPDQAMER